ncbi:DNA-binding GntR family transcriptional regulator [Streptosporangium becharense]|uniref:DNA-binding GntR family transcriptional regulator n=1 Tax=Streptosporangium becharense TaxID=1816182 RepID=A0A7W9MK47_9ACTN|nr:GntR family transcriptional regulator [Streptosporangium becharense]MBB2909347.1 DNA-binding GntR family transcriptional regulator [Streptosporangium becharense]MBB5823750.1 DNA-binding GntR family transcriptional regulator [Streptosporangium becharense]
MIDPEADRPLYKQLADLVRNEISRGRLAPAQRVPAELDYVQRYGLSRDTVRRAMALLRSEGLIVTTSRGSLVRAEQERETVVLAAGEVLTARMPSPEERLRVGVKEGVPVFVINREGEEPRLLPADRWEVTGR